MSLQNLFVAKLPRNLTDSDLQQIFAEYEPASAKIMLDAASGKSKGFGFVLFDSEVKGAAAYAALNRKSTRACGHNFTLVIYPSNHDGRSANEASNALYIRNIPLSVPQDRVEHFLQTFGTLTYCAMREDHYGCPVWVVYAEYQHVEDAKNALQKLHGSNTYFHGSAPILAKFEDSDEAKRERRRRREGAHGAPLQSGQTSGCVFPPPRRSGTNSGAAMGSAGVELGASEAASIHSLPLQQQYAQSAPSPFSGMFGASPLNNRGVSNGYAAGGTSGNGSHGMDGTTAGFSSNSSMPFMQGMVSASPPPYHVSQTSTGTGSPATIFEGSSAAYPSMPTTQLLRSTPGYCYTLGEGGQQIFIPMNSLNAPQLPHPQTSPGPSSAFLNPQIQSAPVTNPSSSGMQASGGFSLLNPQPTNTVVLLDGGQQFVLTKNAINLSNLSSQSKQLFISSSPPPGSSSSPFTSQNAHASLTSPTQFDGGASSTATPLMLAPFVSGYSPA